MRFLVPSLLGLSGLLSATAVAAVVVRGEVTNFLSVRPSLAKEYESEELIPTKKYFSKFFPAWFI